jgi:hypothetical protein
MKLFRTLLSIAAVWAACMMAVTMAFSPEMFGAAGVISAGLVFTAPGGAATAFTFNLTYLPEFLTYTAGTQLTSLRIETQEDGVLHDWTQAGLNAMTNFMKVGASAANTHVFRLGDGELRPKNVTISGVTAAAGAVPFFANSDNPGAVPFKSSNANVLALNPTLFEKFTAVFLPTMATATDYAEITFDNGHTQRYEMEELRNLSRFYQQVEGIIINNVNGYIKKAVVRCAAATPAYILSVKL